MKLIRKIGFLLCFTLPVLIVLGFYSGSYYNFLLPLWVFILIPILDFVIGLDDQSIFSKEEKEHLENQSFFKWVTYMWVVVQFIYLFWATYVIASFNLEWWVFSLLCLNTGVITGGVGIVVAHELGHKKSSLERFLAKALLMTVCYMHFYIEHNRGHHVHVATPADPATALKNESYFKFWWKAVVHGFLHAWNWRKND